MLCVAGEGAGARCGQTHQSGPENENGYTRADGGLLEQTRKVGTARKASLVFQGVPIFYAPMLSFPLANERKSGLLAPTFSLSGGNGSELATPSYWAIAPDMD